MSVYSIRNIDRYRNGEDSLGCVGRYVDGVVNLEGRGYVIIFLRD